MVSIRRTAVKCAAAELVLEATAGPVDGEDFTVVGEPVQYRRCDVVAEELAPAIESDEDISVANVLISDSELVMYQQRPSPLAPPVRWKTSALPRGGRLR
jgi:hypothetical protein